MIIVDKMISVYMCLILSNVILSAEISINTYTLIRKHIINQSLNQFISNRFMSFKLKTCSTAYVDLLYRKHDFHPSYEIVIGSMNAESYIQRGLSRTRLCGSKQQVDYCDVDADFFVNWNDYTINVGLGLESNGSVFLTWTSSSTLLPILNIGIRTIKLGEWMFYTSDIPSTSEETVKRTTIGDYLIPTNVTRHSQKTTANDLSTISIGTSIPSQSYTLTDILTMSEETTELPETTRTDGMTSTSVYLQSRITNDDTEISDTAAASTSTKSTTIPLKLVTTPSSLSMGGTATCTEPSTSTCKCNCPKASVTPINNDLIDQLKIDKKTLSSYKRRQKSATDPRKSSFYIGCVGITVLVISVAFIVLLDCIPRA